MPKTPRNAPPIARIGMPKFSTNLHRLRVNKGLSQSDLARTIWGTTTDSRGYTVPKNKDRISRWENGDQTPEPHNLQALADALGVTVDELAPDITARAMAEDSAPAVQMTMVQGQPGRVHLIVNTLTSLDVASKIIAMLSNDQDLLASAAG